MQNQEWNLGEKSRKGIRREVETAVLVGIILPNSTEEVEMEYLDELAFLAMTAGADTKKVFVQRLKHPAKRTFIGSGKLQEIKIYVDEHDIDMVIFDDDLTPTQQNNIEKELEIKVLDRSSLILDIFAERAQTAQAKTQVELAQLQYLLPRLRGLWTHLERQKGGIGMRGPGEKEIETDRRIVREKISKLKKQLQKIDRQNETRRNQRGQLIRVALVGYTNVGKSTLMNALSKSDVFAENKLFATLDTTVRKVVLGNTPFLLSDTVGFIRKLPHHLVESFKSTLDEVRECDILLHVVDTSHDTYEDQISVVDRTLLDLGVSEKQEILVFNKIDAFREKTFDKMLDSDVRAELEAEFKANMKTRYQKECVFISALKRDNLDTFREIIKEKVLAAYQERYPYQAKTLW